MRKYTVKLCPRCGKEFHVTSRKPNQKTCSQECRFRLVAPIPIPIHDAESNTYRIPVDGGLFAVVDACDVDLAECYWLVDRKPNRDAVYLFRNLPRVDGRRKREYLHRVILSRALGRELTRHELTDHIDRDGLNCRRSNLRLADYTQNGANAKQRVTSQSPHKGVDWHARANKWRARIHVEGREIHLGLFEHLNDAIRAYMHAAHRHFGEFANDGNVD